MILRRGTLALLLLWLAGAVGAVAIAATGVEDPPLAGPRGTIDPAPAGAPSKPGVVRGNPLWAIPLSALSNTRERPIFTSSRRPSAPVVIAVPPAASLPKAPAKPAEERLNLALIGTVVSGTEGIGIFLDQPSQRLVRLRTGEQHAGWTLRSVRAREVTLEKGPRSQILSLPKPGAVPQPGSGVVPQPQQQL